MDKYSRSIKLFLFLFIIVTFQSHSAVGEGGQLDAQIEPVQPSIIKLVTNTISTLKRSHQSYWGKVKTIINGMQMQFSPPNLDFRGSDKADSGDGVGGEGTRGTMKKAAEKSFGASKETVEGFAKSTAKVVGEAINKATEKVNEREKDESEAEL
ncbi:Transmembrane protein [Quillaja saponaria]|uniref:Transmembrane protein n=1 Tax=Quillaja saponaria TaxID=32244 RepID=A0AAD7LGZ8_QUISA|nr:Transmembrane protein [Quillaja saponaria]